MKNKLKLWITRTVLSALMVNMMAGSGYAVDIPLGDVNLTVLGNVATSVTTASLVKWRVGTPNTQPISAGGTMTFQWFASHTTLPVNALDHTSNQAGTAQSDDAVAMTYQRGTQVPGLGVQSILMYSDNPAGSDGNGTDTSTDPLYFVNSRGGLVGGGGLITDPARVSVLPMSFKAATLGDLVAVSSADVNNASKAIPSTNRVALYGEIDNPNGGTCPAADYGHFKTDGVTVNTRSNAGFCDFAQRFDIDDKNYINADGHSQGLYCDAGRFFQDYQPGHICPNPTNENNAFKYSTVANSFGVPLDEANTSYDGIDQPMYFVIGVNFSSALSAHYSSTIKVNNFVE